MHPALHIGTAGWQLSKDLSARRDGSALERYAEHLNAVEINSTHYKHHMERTFQRWAASVPRDFRFAVKMHRDITHGQRLTQVGPVQEFLKEVIALGDRLGPVLVQLPPSLAWSDTCGDVLEAMREVYDGTVVLEPRHPSWSSGPVLRRLQQAHISVVAADPPLIIPTLKPLGDPAMCYFRLHGNPRVYWSPYEEAALRKVAIQVEELLKLRRRVWVVFDNTASGQAAPNALRLKRVLGARDSV